MAPICAVENEIGEHAGMKAAFGAPLADKRDLALCTAPEEGRLAFGLELLDPRCRAELRREP